MLLKINNDVALEHCKKTKWKKQNEHRSKRRRWYWKTTDGYIYRTEHGRLSRSVMEWVSEH